MAGEQSAFTAANRFGLGARPGEIREISADPRGWLAQQVSRSAAFAIPSEGLPSLAEAAGAFQSYRQAQAVRRASEREPPTAPQAEPQTGLARGLREITAREGSARMALALTTRAPFAERLAWFWANHFTVAATKATVIPFVGLYEREAVRAHLAGSFAELVLAAVRHPGMLLYLDQAQSIGPNSQAGQRRGLGLNENLARELLELHTLGAQGGYTQADVTEFARALTGWTIGSPRLQRFTPRTREGEFVFVPLLHEPGARTVLGKRYPEGGEEQARAIILDLARHPATARRVASKLARHFVGDTPPDTVVARLERTFRDTDGDLPSLHRTLFDLPEAWAPEPVKLKSPQEFVVSALRLAGLQDVDVRSIATGLELLGQPLYRAPSPEGWPDDADSWASPDALMKRLEWSQAFAQRLSVPARPEDLGVETLGPVLSARSREAVRRAESAAQGFVLLLMSPEFQRR